MAASASAAAVMGCWYREVLGAHAIAESHDGMPVKHGDQPTVRGQAAGHTAGLVTPFTPIGPVDPAGPAQIRCGRAVRGLAHPLNLGLLLQAGVIPVLPKPQTISFDVAAQSPAFGRKVADDS